VIANRDGHRGHCLTKSRRYSTTFRALRQAREQHVHDRLGKSDDPSRRALAEIEPADPDRELQLRRTRPSLAQVAAHVLA
jgi:hypothetical protein